MSHPSLESTRTVGQAVKRLKARKEQERLGLPSEDLSEQVRPTTAVCHVLRVGLQWSP